MIGARGETSIMLDGQSYTLCLTLGALAELETLFGCGSLTDLQMRLRKLSANEMSQVLSVLLRAGGRDGPVKDLLPKQAAKAIAEAFHAALG